MLEIHGGSDWRNLAAIKFAFQLKEQYPKIRQALLLECNVITGTYLSEQLVVLALTDDEDIKMKMLQQLVGFAILDHIKMGKPELRVISMSTKLQELIGLQSWLVLKVAEVDREDVKNWITGEAPVIWCFEKVHQAEHMCYRLC
jgi:hypothetical protein